MRPTAFELLEPIVLLSGNTTTTLADSAFIRSKEVSNFSVAYRKMHDGSIHGVQTDDPIFQLAEETNFDGQQHIEVAHETAFELSEGTFAMKFTVDDPDPANDTPAVQTLFSKDASGNGDGGHISAYLYEGRIKVRFQSITDSLHLWTPENSIETGQEYHLALTFGSAGAWLYLNGKMADWNIEFTQGLQSNSEAMVLGANTANRSDRSPTHVSNRFAGHLLDFSLHDQQYSRHQVATIAGRFRFEPPRVDGREYGADRDESLNGSDVHGGYGDDTITGTSGNDRLDGGHGEDRLLGGAGDDLLLSRSDGREPVIAQDFDADYDPDGEVDSVTRTLYPYQPIEADDVLVGGPGADTFRFESLISAKEEIILRHVMDNGMIHWHGVAGENARVHDHWVDRIGNDVIEDFNREEGDKIEIAGHTIDVYDLRHIDSDDDGILDASVLYLQSNQGNAGAHNKDKIGTITVFGDLVFESDYTFDAKPAYGIVDSIFSLDEAIGPRKGTPIIQDGTPPPLPIPSDGTLPTDGVFGLLNEVQFSGERGDHIEVAHKENLQLDHGTISLKFTPDDVDGSHTLFSKDAYGNADGGHLTAFIHNGRIKVRMQSEDGEAWLKSPDNSIQVGQEHHLAVTFGSNGVWLFVDGTVVDADVLFMQDWQANTEGMAIGANVWNRSDLDRDGASAHFAGSIRDFVIYDSQFDRGRVAQLAQ